MDSLQTKSLGELGREDELYRCNSSQPHVSYADAMRARFEWQGCMYNIETCPLTILYTWLKACCSHCPSVHRADILDVLRDPDADLLSRWYAIDSGLVHKVLRMEGAILVRVDRKPVTQEKEKDTPDMAKKFTKIEPRAPHSPETKPVEDMSLKTKRAAIARPKIARPMVKRAGRNDATGQNSAR